MTVPAELDQGSRIETSLSDFETIAHLGKVAAGFRNQLSELERTIEDMYAGPYVSPEGRAIEVVPEGTSREIALVGEIFRPRYGGTYVRLDPTNGEYHGPVRARGQYDWYFHGRSIERDEKTGELWVYNDRRSFRVLASRDVRFYEVETA